MQNTTLSLPRVSLVAASLAAVFLAGCQGPRSASAPDSEAAPLAVSPAAKVGDAARTAPLLDTLRSATAPLHDRARACQQLAVVGSSDAVPALAGLLADPQLGDYAREALECMPHPDAGAALREALGRLEGRPLLGAIHSVGARRDGGSVDALARLLRRPEPDVSVEAARALGRIGGQAALRHLRNRLETPPSDEALRSAAEACNEAAHAALGLGRASEARALFEAVLRTPVPGQPRLTAALGLLRAQGEGAAEAVIRHLESGDAASVAVGLRAVREIPGEALTRRLEAYFSGARPAVRAELLPALADRVGARFARTAEACVDEAAPRAVRLAAIRALGRIGSGTSVTPLLRTAAAAGDAEAAAAALTSLSQLRADGVDAAVLSSLERADAGLKAKLIGVLGQRGNAAVAGAVLQLAASADPAVSRAAFRALDSLSRPGDQREIFRLLRACKDDEGRRLLERAAIVAAMKSETPERRTTVVVEELAGAADPAYRAALQRVRDKLTAQSR